MNSTQSNFSTRLKVGIFATIGIVLICVITVVTNGRPYWWRPCQLVSISIEDATGLKTKSPIRSLGIEIGYLKSVSLAESHVTLGICVTAPVEILPSTRAYIRGEGFLGDKFVELKPVRYVAPEKQAEPSVLHTFLDALLPSAYAEAAPAEKNSAQGPQGEDKKEGKAGKEIPVGAESEDVQHLVNRVDELVHQMSGLTDNLRSSLDPEQLRSTMKQLNRTLENASRTLAPEGGLNQTAQRTLAKLEDAIEQLRDLMTRVNKGEGSIGMLLNDPSYAEEIHVAIKNINKLLNRVQDVRFAVDVGATYVTGYSGARGWFNLGIWPKKNRYYLIGIALDPRGKISNQTVTTTSGGITTITQTQTVDPTSILFTAMFGQIFWNNRLDLSAGALYGDGAGSVLVHLGPTGDEEKLSIRTDAYFRTSVAVGGFDARLAVSYKPFGGVLKSFYVRAGVESFRGYQGVAPIFILGGGLAFDDEDIKLLFSLR